jgi:hypothetical protein
LTGVVGRYGGGCAARWMRRSLPLKGDGPAATQARRPSISRTAQGGARRDEEAVPSICPR